MAEALAKHLVRTVGRAFYDDDAIVILDALCREKFLLDHDLPGRGPLDQRFGVGSKQLRRTLQLLYDDCLVEKYERTYKDPLAEKGTRKKRRTFWYINYLHAVKIIRLRLHFMVKAIDDLEAERVSNCASYCCPKCNREYDLATAIGFVKDGEFYCQRCFLDEDEMTFLSEVSSSTKMTAQDKNAVSLKDKFRAQLSEQRGVRDGIMEILHQIDTFPRAPPLNLPSDHIETAEQEAKERSEERDDDASDRYGSGVTSSNFVDEQGLNVSVVLKSSKVEEQRKEDEEEGAQEACPVWMRFDVSGKEVASESRPNSGASLKRFKGAPGAEKAKYVPQSSRFGASQMLAAKRDRVENEIPDVSSKNSVSALEKGREDEEFERKQYESTVIIKVSGVEKPLSSITKADLVAMSDEEYAAYFKEKRLGSGIGSCDAFEVGNEEEDFF